MSVPTPYKLVAPDRARCNHCKKPIHLLTTEKNLSDNLMAVIEMPQFWICWRCQRVWHVLHAEVKEDV